MKKQEKILKGFLAAALMLLALGLFGCGANMNVDNETTVPESTIQEETVVTEPAATEAVVAMPWDDAGAKQPADYAWEEYEALTGTQQRAFRQHLGEGSYGLWLENMRENADVKPWDEPKAKQPMEYSWAEFEALSSEDQIAFQNYLGMDGFSEWMNRVQSQMEDIPWEKNDAKQPGNYTWEEFENLTGAQQILFQYHLGAEGFQRWLEDAEYQDEVLPWEADGTRQPADYTWAEFETLTPELQMAFQTALGAEGFVSWMNQAQTQTVTNPWEKRGAKQPEDYTWKAFEALSPEQQMAFQNYLGEEVFENWLNEAQSQTEANPWEKRGAKQPEEYTWEEFEALSPAQQMAFQDELGLEAFDAWLIQTGH